MNTVKHYDQLKLDSQLCFPLYACARKVVNFYTPYFRPLGITYTQYIVFLVLWEQDDITVGDLCRRLYLDSGTLTPMLKKLETAGYLKRRRSEKDERVVMVRLTEKGWELRDRVKEIPAQVSPCVGLSLEEAQTLYGLLYQILGKE